MMNKLFVFIMIMLCASANAYVLCGPAVRGMDVGYGKLSATNGVVRMPWAVGINCVGETDDIDGVNMCESPSVIGEAGCVSKSGYNDSVINDEDFKTSGTRCYCRRTHVRINGELKESPGKWIITGENTTGNSCFDFCPRACVENVVNNRDGLRNNIMLLRQPQ